MEIKMRNPKWTLNYNGRDAGDEHSILSPHKGPHSCLGQKWRVHSIPACVWRIKSKFTCPRTPIFKGEASWLAFNRQGNWIPNYSAKRKGSWFLRGWATPAFKNQKSNVLNPILGNPSAPFLLHNVSNSHISLPSQIPSGRMGWDRHRLTTSKQNSWVSVKAWRCLCSSPGVGNLLLTPLVRLMRREIQQVGSGVSCQAGTQLGDHGTKKNPKKSPGIGLGSWRVKAAAGLHLQTAQGMQEVDLTECQSIPSERITFNLRWKPPRGASWHLPNHRKWIFSVYIDFLISLFME